MPFLRFINRNYLAIDSDSTNGPTYRLARFFSDILQNVVGKSEYTVKDSWTLKEKSKSWKISNNHVLISLDVASLFTNIPLHVIIDTVKKRWDKIKDHTSIPMNEFTKGLSLCLENNVFVFNRIPYKQIFGTAMGSLLSPAVANLVMEKWEE